MYCLTDFCCICFYNNKPFKHLCDKDNDNITYHFKLTSCVPEMCFNEMNDQRLICNKCFETMNTVYKFRQTCLTSKTMLMDYISQLRTVSDVSGAANVHLIDIKQEYQNENNIETNFEQIYLFTDVQKCHNEIENSEINSTSYMLTDNISNNIKTEYIKKENENQNSKKYVEESFNNYLKNQDDVKIDIIENNVKLTISEIKIESEKEDIEEHSPASFDNTLVSCDSANEDTECLDECNEPSSMNQDEIKADTDNEKIHLRVHERKKLNECNICQKSYNCPRSLKIHMRTHTGEMLYECSVCEKKFNRKQNLKIHLQIHTGEKPYECSVCKKKFKILQHLKSHMRMHTKEKPYECSVCKKKFKHPHDLKRHMYIHTGEKPYECSVCNKKFRQSGAVKSHMKIHTEEKPYECNICNNTFKQSYDLKRHLIIHSEEKPYECSICKKKLKLLRELQTHMKTHTGEISYECSFCEKSFRWAVELKNHLRIHTGETCYVCSVCNKKFKLLCNFTAHMRIHTEKKPYECTVCKKKFKLSGELKNHMKIHPGENTYTCSVCKKSFNQTGELKIHMMVHKEKLSECKKIFIQSQNDNKTSKADQNTQKYIEESLDCSRGNQGDVQDVIIKNDNKLTSSEIEKETKTEDIVKHASTSFNNLSSCDSENLEQVSLFTDVVKYHNEIEISEIKTEYYPASCKLSDNTSINIKKENIKLENENQNSEKYVKESFDSFLENEDENKIDITENDVKLTISEIKNEIKNQDIEEPSPASVDNILPSCDDENEDMEHLDECYQDSLMNRDKSKTDTVNHDTEKPHMRVQLSECSICKNIFKSSRSLNIHMRAHTGETPYDCSVCKKKFKQTPDLKRHMYIHTGEKPYECSVCDKKFNQICNLKRHLRTHEGENFMNV